MSEENVNVKSNTNAEEPPKRDLTPEEKEAKRVETRAILIEKFPEVAIKGKIDLIDPILSKDQEVKVLHYDFSKLNSTELVAALDSDPNNRGNAGFISHHQAMNMFALACEKAERPISGIDSQDVLERLSMRDVIAVTRAARAFFKSTLAVALTSTSAM